MKKIAIFSVGSGGHVIPAKNIVNELIDDGVPIDRFIFITDKRGIEYLADTKVKVSVLDVYRSNYGLLGYVFNFYKFIKTIHKARKILIKEKVSILFTTGSYIAPIASLLSYKMKMKLFIQEQNIHAGLGNKIASIFPGVVFTSYPDTKNLYKKRVLHVGPIINKNLLKNKNLNTSKFTLGIQGGSQGSEEVNNLFYEFYKKNYMSEINILHITGKGKEFNKIDDPNYIQHGFINDMNTYYSDIHLQISRSGGGSLEAAYLGIPQILIPYKHGTTSSHQFLNAQYLEKIGLAVIVNSYNELDIILKKILNNLDNWRNLYFKENIIESGNKKITDMILKEINEEL